MLNYDLNGILPQLTILECPPLYRTNGAKPQEGEKNKIKESEVKMAGTKAGGLKAARTNKLRHGDDFYSRIGKKGGHLGTTGGFASKKKDANGMTGAERASFYGAVGGHISKRGPAKGETK